MTSELKISVSETAAYKLLKDASESRIETELQLVQLKNMVRALDESSIISIIDTEGYIKYVNDKFCLVSKYSRVEILGKKIQTIRAEIHPPEFYDELWSTIKSGSVWSGEICSKAKDGIYFWNKATIVPFFDKYGKIIEYIVIRKDIAQQKKNEMFQAIGELSARISSHAIETISKQHEQLIAHEIKDGTIKIHTLLKKNGFGPISITAERIFSESIDESLSYFGKQVTQSLMKGLSEITTAPETDHFQYYALTKQVIAKKVNQKTSEDVLEKTRIEILRRLNTYSQKAILELLKEIHYNETIKFINNLNGHERILYLWKDCELKDKIFSEFFNNDSASKIFFSESAAPLKNLVNITYSELLGDKENAIKNKSKFINTIHLSNTSRDPTFVAEDDCTKWFEHGLTNEFIDFRHSMDDYFEENLICGLNGFRLEKIPDSKTLEKLFLGYQYVVLDDPLTVYKKSI